MGRKAKYSKLSKIKAVTKYLNGNGLLFNQLRIQYVIM